VDLSCRFAHALASVATVSSTRWPVQGSATEEVNV
jgi:hypothetical protein